MINSYLFIADLPTAHEKWFERVCVHVHEVRRYYHLRASSAWHETQS